MGTAAHQGCRMVFFSLLYMNKEGEADTLFSTQAKHHVSVHVLVAVVVFFNQTCKLERRTLVCKQILT